MHIHKYTAWSEIFVLVKKIPNDSNKIYELRKQNRYCKKCRKIKERNVEV